MVPVDKSMESKLMSRIRGWGRGHVFTPRDFLDLGNRGSVDVALTRLESSGTIRRLSRGVYDFPIAHPVMGTLAPTVEAVAKALVGRDSVRLQPSGAYAANLLGLNQQVPSQVVFLTDGPARSVRFGNRTIVLRRTTPRNMESAGRTGGLVIQALRHIGKDRVTPEMVEHLRTVISADDRRRLKKDALFAPAWIAAIMNKIAKEDTEHG